MLSGFVIAGGSSGSGKTTMTMGLMSVIQNRGYTVNAFKAGPDYIDPMFHRRVIGKSSYNLPLYLLEEDVVRQLFEKHATASTFQIIEGVMGYLDGHDIKTPFGSTAHLARVIDMPVVLVVEASGMALTAVAMIKGLIDFYQPSPIKGIIFNQLNSRGHYELLKNAVELHLGIKCYGYLPYQSDLLIKSRHLGLLQAQEIENFEKVMDQLNILIEENIEVSALINDFYCDDTLDVVDAKYNQEYDLFAPLRIAIAKDEAFSFYYDENLESLSKRGVEWIPFSPMRDSHLPDCDGVYLGGGYPEVFAETLASNTAMLGDVLSKLEQDLPVYAECGGLMYLAKTIVQCDESAFRMVGFFDAESKMTELLQHFGHVSAKLELDGLEIDYRGHEFHKSVFIPQVPIETTITVNKGQRQWHCGFHKKNVIATYVHNHHYSNLAFEDFLIKHWSKNRR